MISKVALCGPMYICSVPLQSQRTVQYCCQSDAHAVCCAAGQDSGSRFTELLKLGNESGNYSQFVTLLRSMSPTAIDQELRALEVTVPACFLSCSAGIDVMTARRGCYLVI